MDERTAATEAKLGVAFTLECRDKDGNLLKTIGVKGGIPIELKEAPDVPVEVRQD